MSSKLSKNEGLSKITLPPKIQPFSLDESLNTNVMTNKPDLNLHENNDNADNGDNSIIKHKNGLFSVESSSWSQANLFVSTVISSIYAIHTIYFEYIRENHSYSNTYEHFQVSLALSVLNLIPSLTLLMDIYSFIMSFAVLIHVTWMAYHTLTVWAVELCYGAINNGCDAIMLYKNITLSLQSVIVSHQILLLIAGCYHNKIRQQTTQSIQAQTAILEKASNLDLDSESETEMSGDEYIADEVDLTMLPTMTIENEFTISESAAEEIEIEKVLTKLDKKSHNKRFKKSNVSHTILEECSPASQSTFEEYGVGSPKETHGKHLKKPKGMTKLQT